MRRKARPGDPELWWALLVPFLALIVPAVCGANLLDGYSSVQWVVFASLCWASYRISRIVALGRPRIMSLGFWAYVYLFLCLAPLVQLSTGFPLPGSFSTPASDYRQSTKLIAALIVLVGIIAYDGARRIARRNPGSGSLDQFTARTLTPSKARRLIAAAYPCSAVGIAIVGLGNLLTSRQAVSDAVGGDAAGALIIAVMTVPAFLALYFALALRREHGPGYRPSSIQIVGLVLLNLIVNNPIASPRFWVGVMAIALASIYLDLDRPRTFRRFALVWVAAFVIVFPYADAFRLTGSQLRIEQTPAELFTTKSDHDSFQQTINTIDWVDDNGLTMGRQALGVALFWVPRPLWADKPQDTGAMLGEDLQYPNTNLSLPLWAEGYVNFGFLGVVLFLGALGWISERLETIWLNRRQFGSAGLLVPVLAGYQIFCLRGSLLTTMGRLVVILLVFTAATSGLRAVERRRRRVVWPHAAHR